MLNSVHWKQIRGNPFVQPLHPRMLTEEGYTVSKLVKLTGESKHSERTKVMVLYNRDYLIKWLITYIFSKLQPQSLDDVSQLMSEAYEKWIEDLDNL
jgi:hypothetical protein